MNKINAMFDEMRGRTAFINEFAYEYGSGGGGSGGSTNNSGNSNKGGGIRLGSDGASDEEIYAMAVALGAVTGSEIIIDKNGIITDVRNTSEVAKYQQSRDWLIEMMSKVKENDITLILSFFDPDMLGETGSGFFQNGALCGESFPTAGILDYMFLSPINDKSYYIYKSGEEDVLFGLLSWSRNTYALYPYTVERVIGHEFFGHAFDYIIYGNINRSEEFAMSRANSIGLIFGQPKRYSYYYKTGFSLIPYGVNAP